MAPNEMLVIWLAIQEDKLKSKKKSLNNFQTSIKSPHSIDDNLLNFV